MSLRLISLALLKYFLPITLTLLCIIPNVIPSLLFILGNSVRLPNACTVAVLHCCSAKVQLSQCDDSLVDPLEPLVYRAVKTILRHYFILTPSSPDSTRPKIAYRNVALQQYSSVAVALLVFAKESFYFGLLDRIKFE